jgi:hypothetical protein
MHIYEECDSGILEHWSSKDVIMKGNICLIIFDLKSNLYLVGIKFMINNWIYKGIPLVDLHCKNHEVHA